MNELPMSTRPALRERLRDKLPEILIEAGSVVLALLLAIGVGVWHEKQQQQELAAQARSAILAELRENLGEIGKLHVSLDKNLVELQAAAKADAPSKGDLSVNLGLALASEAAWRAALASDAVRHLDFAWITNVGKVYELQEIVMRAQSLAVEQLADITDENADSRRVIAQRLLSRQRALAQLVTGLEQNYHDVLATP